MPKKIEFTKEQEERIFELFQQDVPLPKIAKEIGVTTNKSIQRVLADVYGITDFMKLAKVGDVIRDWKIVDIYVDRIYDRNLSMAKIISVDPNFPAEKTVMLTTLTNLKITKPSFKRVYEPWNKRHNESNQRLYRIWAGMLSRTRNKDKMKLTTYYKYNITCCDDWLKYDNFREWALNSGYSDDLSLDRINPLGNYGPENCRWANRRTQAVNKVGFNKDEYTAFGESKTIYDWIIDERCVVKLTTLKYRIGAGWDIEKAITTPSERKSVISFKEWAMNQRPEIYQEYLNETAVIGTI